jgi:GT2 family glycosyltransferase
MSEAKVAVVILNFNGKHFLEKFLPGIITHSAPHQIVVADNGSSDDSVSFLKKNYTSVTIIENGGNFGYAKGYNLALHKLEADYYVLLNSDVEVTPGWIEPIIKLMEKDHSMGACQPKVMDYGNRNIFEYAGAAGGFIDKYGYPFCRGRIFNSLEEDKGQFDDTCEVFWATGACLFVKSSAFKQVGGFDESYFAHMEEIDLCWRLKNFGYKIFIEPSSVIYHIGGGTLNKLSKQKTFLNFRNNLTTLTKNHPAKNLFFKIIYRMILDGVAAFKFLFDGQPKHFFAVIRAHFAYYLWLPKILKQRKQLKNLPEFKFDMRGVYIGSIVKEYFLQHKKKFNELKSGFLSE